MLPLIRGLLDVPGLERLRLSSIEPSTVDEALIELMAGHPRFARHLHIPFQSGSDTVLENMRRGYTSQAVRDLVERVASRIPGCGLGTDVICGFPGEREEDFRATFDLLEGLPFTYLHAFSYSVRPGSEAERLGDPVSGDLKRRRVQALKRLMREKSRAFSRTHVSATLEVLPEPDRRGGTRRLAGWTDNYLRVDLGEGESAGSGLVRARITGVTDSGLVGVVL